MVDFIRDAEITALLTSDGCAAMGTGSGEAQQISEAMGGGLAIVLDKENGQAYIGAGSVLTGALQTLVYEYDFALLGGVIGDIVLDGPALPANFVIQNGFIEVLTDVTSLGSATISFGTKAGSGTNLTAAIAKATLVAGYRALVIPDFATIADWVKETAEREPICAVATAAVTAGRIKLILNGQIVA